MYQTENEASTVDKKFSRIWPSDLVFDPTRPILELVWDVIEANILTEFHKYENVAFRVHTRFSRIWPSDLAFDLTWPILKLVWYIIDVNILTKFHKYQTENVASRVY